MANDLNTKLEEALKSVIDALTIAGVAAANTGLDDDDLNAPYVMCTASTSTEETVPRLGYFTLNAVVTIATNADDSGALAAHRTRVATVRDELLDTSLAETLSAAVTGFHVPYGGVYFTGLGEDVRDQMLISTVELDIIACGSDVID